jgi:hypothetical protein
MLGMPAGFGLGLKVFRLSGQEWEFKKFKNDEPKLYKPDSVYPCIHRQ